MFLQCFSPSTRRQSKISHPHFMLSRPCVPALKRPPWGLNSNIWALFVQLDKIFLQCLDVFSIGVHGMVFLEAWGKAWTSEWQIYLIQPIQLRCLNKTQQQTGLHPEMFCFLQQSNRNYPWTTMTYPSHSGLVDNRRSPFRKSISMWAWGRNWMFLSHSPPDILTVSSLNTEISVFGGECVMETQHRCILYLERLALFTNTAAYNYMWGETK